jgi:hypothetical protein
MPIPNSYVSARCWICGSLHCREHFCLSCNNHHQYAHCNHYKCGQCCKQSCNCSPAAKEDRECDS